MYDVLEEMVGFVKFGTPSRTFDGLENEVDPVKLKLIFENLLAWILVRHIRNKPLFLMTSWQKPLAEIIKSKAAFRSLFTVNGDYVDFADDISPEIRAEIREWLFDRWRPIVVGDP